MGCCSPPLVRPAGEMPEGCTGGIARVSTRGVAGVWCKLVYSITRRLPCSSYGGKAAPAGPSRTVGQNPRWQPPKCRQAISRLVGPLGAGRGVWIERTTIACVRSCACGSISSRCLTVRPSYPVEIAFETVCIALCRGVERSMDVRNLFYNQFASLGRFATAYERSRHS